MNAPEALQLGLHKSMPAERYHSIAAMSAGGLKRMRMSPAHFYGLQLDPRRPPAGSTDALALGSLFHTALFEPGELAARYVVKPAGLDGRTKEGKAWAAEHADREIVDAAKHGAALDMAAAVRALPDIAALMADGFAESSAFWLDDHTGELCKWRPDWTSPAGDRVVLVDGKSCPDASPEGFGRTAWNMGYLHTAAWYVDGFEAATGQKVLGYVFAAVEHDWPHVAAPYMVPDDVLDKARSENRRLLDLYAECRRTGVWPGYSSGVSLLQLPAWAQRQMEHA